MEEWKTKEKVEDNYNPLGLSIIPVGSTKIPFKPWVKYQKELAPNADWHSHFINQGNIGIITGKVSGNLECIDVDVKNDLKRTIMTEYADLIPDDLLKKMIIQTTPNNGFHLIYRCPDVVIEANQKLALETNKEVIIETRGEGGYFCTSKVNNKIAQGTFDLEKLNINIPIITKDERHFLLETARSLTRYFPSTNTEKKEKEFKYNEPAINEFNEDYNIIELFDKHDWSVVKEDDEKVYLLRNGSLATHSGYYFKDKKVFFCFSTSTDFKAEKPYNHFQVLQVLEGKDDYKTTLRLLTRYGYDIRATNKPDKITPEAISEFLTKQGVKYDSFIQDLTMNGKIIEEIDYNTLFIDLKKHFDKQIPRTRFEEIIKSRYITTINPILEFIGKASHIDHPVPI